MSRRFTVVLEPEIEGGFSVHIPALPGCTSQGETMAEALSNIKEASELYLWSLKDDGLSVPESGSEVVLKEIEVNV